MIDTPETSIADIPGRPTEAIPGPQPLEEEDHLDSHEDAFDDSLSHKPGSADAVQSATWDMLTMREGAPDGPLIVSVNQPFLFYSIAGCFADDRTVINLSVPDRAAHLCQRDTGYAALIDEDADLLASRYQGCARAFIGQCIDGMAALHIARRPEARGFDLLPAAPIGVWAPSRPDTTPSSALRKWRKIKLSARRLMDYTNRKLRGQLSWRDFAQHSIAKRVLRATGKAPKPSEGQKLLLDVNHHHQEVGRVHPFTPWDGDVPFFATDSQPKHAFRTRFNWEGLLAPDAPIYRVSGEHEDALLDQGYRRVAEVVDKRISREFDTPSRFDRR